MATHKTHSSDQYAPDPAATPQTVHGSATDTDSHRYRTTPRPVTTIEHTRIPLRDGVELAARIWLPSDLDGGAVPAVLEYIPYRKNDMTAGRDQTIHPEFARAGYASIRVDLRGAGDSTGVMTDEYSATELDDGLQVLSWIAAQDWCTGRVGIIGKSWGGFNGLQIAALKPKELAAIITVCSTDDRYADDVHYNGGAIVGDQMLSWASTMWAYNARPQDPAVMPDWQDDWIRRIHEAPVNIEDWLGHQRRDDYWKHASVCETPEAIEVPVLAVGGLLDEYRTTLFRLLDNAEEQRTSNPDYPPVHALLGPWAHNYPHQAAPGPGIDFIAEAVAWWDQWMSGIDNGVKEQPQLRAYVTESAPIGSDRQTRPGRWVAEQSWPSPQVRQEIFSAETALVDSPEVLRSTELLGFQGGSWLQFGEAAGMAGDQAADDAKSYTADWPVPEAGLEVLGTPHVKVSVSSNRDRGVIAARLCDVAPDGSSRLLTTGLFNLTHHSGHEHPQALTPGEVVDLDVELLSTAHRLAPGHRLRLSISASFFPNLWPSPEETEIRLHGAPELELPIRTPTSAKEDGTRSTEVTAALGTPPTPPVTTIEATDIPMTRKLVQDLVAGTATVTTVTEGWQTNTSDGLFYASWERDSYSRSCHDPDATEAVSERHIRYRRPALSADMSAAGGQARTLAQAALASDSGWDVELRTRSTMTGDKDTFLVTNELTAYSDGEVVTRRATSASIPRDLN